MKAERSLACHRRDTAGRTELHRQMAAAQEKAGLASGKYMIVAEEGTENTKRLHLHVILESGIDRDTL